MPRRKLFAYTMMYAAGIAAGFFIFEKGRTIEALMFVVSVAAAVYLSTVFAGAGRAQKDDPGGEFSAHAAVIMVLLLLAGVAAFSFRYCAYESAVSDCTDDEHTLEGRVCGSRLDGGDLEMTVMRHDSRGRHYKVNVTVHDWVIDGEAADDAADKCRACLLRGYVVRCTGEFREISAADDPGCFDYRLYMRSQSVPVSFRAVEMTVTEESGGILHDFRAELYLAREDFLGRFDDETAGFLRGAIFGDKSEIAEDTLNEFNQNSTGHILAVSGLHMGFLYGLLRALTGRRRTAGISLLIIAVLITYGEMTMWSAATVRACLVMTVSLLSVHLKRPFDLLTSVSLAALILLVREPYQLFSSGFQMSFLAMGAMAFFIKPVSSVTGEALGVMIAVQLGTVPVTACTFYRVNPLAVFINVPVILLASVLVPVSIIALMLRLVTGIIPSAVIYASDLISYAIIRLNGLLNFGGSFSIQAAGHGGAAVVILYAAMFFMASEWTRVRMLRSDRRAVLKKAVLILMPAVMLASCMYDPFSDDGIVFVAVGQGDCTHIRCEGKNVLIDGGGQAYFGSDDTEEGADTGYNVGEKILMPYLLHSGAERVEMALVTHLHTDHYKGITELSEAYPVGRIGIPIDYRGSDLSIFDDNDQDRIGTGGKSGETDGSKVIYMKPDSKVYLSEEVSIEVIWPVEISDEPLAADDPNEHNTVYMIDYKGTKIMVTGDLLEEDEHKMVEYYKKADKGKTESTIDCDILKVAHHGSKSSSCEEFLDAASPEIAVIQCGRNNLYGHPHQQTLDRLAARGIEVFRTDINGAVGIDIRKGGIAVDLFRKK